MVSGGWGGIRTHGTLSRTLVFKTRALNHSATHPLRAVISVLPWGFQARPCAAVRKDTRPQLRTHPFGQNRALTPQN